MHDPGRLKCLKCSCEKFHSSYRCSCKETHDQHKEHVLSLCGTIAKNSGDGFKLLPMCVTLFLNIGKIVVETKEERKAAGKPVGHDVPYIAMGGITGFSSLIDGSQRLDPSGVGDSIGNMYRALE